MHIEKIEFDQVHYNPERGGFDALVRLRDAGQSFDYPCHVPAPLNADFTYISQRLKAVAQARHQARSPGLRATAPEGLESYTSRVARILSEAAIWPGQDQGPQLAA